jgi:ABC-type phosphate transport system permease subunit
MAKNQIKLRREPIDPLDIGRYQDYSALMQRHERKQKRKRVIRFFTFSLIITVIVLILLIIISYLWFGVQKGHQHGLHQAVRPDARLPRTTG